MASMRDRSCVSGCRRPIAGPLPGKVTSTAPAGRRTDDSAARRSSSDVSTNCLNSLICWPSSGRSSGEAAPSAFIKPGTAPPLRPRYLSRRAFRSASVRTAARSAVNWVRRSAMEDTGDVPECRSADGADVRGRRAVVPGSCVRATQAPGTQHRTWHTAPGTAAQVRAAVRPPLPWSASPARRACRTPPHRARRDPPAACGRGRCRRPSGR